MPILQISFLPIFQSCSFQVPNHPAKQLAHELPITTQLVILPLKQNISSFELLKFLLIVDFPFLVSLYLFQKEAVMIQLSTSSHACITCKVICNPDVSLFFF